MSSWCQRKVGAGDGRRGHGNTGHGGQQHCRLLTGRRQPALAASFSPLSPSPPH